MEREVMVVVVVGWGEKKRSQIGKKKRSPGGDRKRERMNFGEQKKAHVGRGSQRSDKETKQQHRLMPINLSGEGGKEGARLPPQMWLQSLPIPAQM